MSGRGAQAETAAAQMLQQQGLQLLARNARTRGGEIDLVMRDGDAVVFVEVRARRSRAFGGAAASVDAAKQQRMVRAARGWLMAHPEHARAALRFDVVAFDGDTAPQWIRNAIETAA